MLLAASAAAMQVEHLRCEYLENPLGIGKPCPRLSWQLVSQLRGESQTAYRILAASNLQLLQVDKDDLWDSGKVSSDQSIQS